MMRCTIIRGELYMHEASLMQNLFKIANEAIKGNRIKYITKINIKVGKLANVMPEALEFAFDALKKGTAFEHAALEIEQAPIVARCDSCAAEYTPERPPFSCPYCSGEYFTIKSGDEIYISSIEAEEE